MPKALYAFKAATRHSTSTLIYARCRHLLACWLEARFFFFFKALMCMRQLLTLHGIRLMRHLARSLMPPRHEVTLSLPACVSYGRGQERVYLLDITRLLISIINTYGSHAVGFQLVTV